MKKIKKEDKVLVLSGNYKGSQGVVLRVFPKKNKAIVHNLNMVKRHSKPSLKNPKGEIKKKEAPIHISNLQKVKEKE
ncbi:50S ribosomal protein L24 [Blattabacterium cuenoti]|uniref:50S ribosomal protein L24 n=1 Tax=Blattabacterium cuenoti TaxID=1653831 RepID=UPI00163CB6A9|nr:50S ribosomal protein L24 [Blattabacterium cuenoti]